jgi:hypothetical protein
LGGHGTLGYSTNNSIHYGRVEAFRNSANNTVHQPGLFGFTGRSRGFVVVVKVLGRLGHLVLKNVDIFFIIFKKNKIFR